MSGRPPRRPPDSDPRHPREPERRRPDYFIGLLTAVLWAATAFAAIGLLSWLLDRDPVAQPVGPAFGFAALAVGGLTVWLGGSATAGAERPWIGMLAASGVVYLGVLAAAFLGGFALFAEQAVSPFVAAAAALAAPAVLAAWALAAPRSRD